MQLELGSCMSAAQEGTRRFQLDLTMVILCLKHFCAGLQINFCITMCVYNFILEWFL